MLQVCEKCLFLFPGNQVLQWNAFPCLHGLPLALSHHFQRQRQLLHLLSDEQPLSFHPQAKGVSQHGMPLENLASMAETEGRPVITSPIRPEEAAAGQEKQPCRQWPSSSSFENKVRISRLSHLKPALCNIRYWNTPGSTWRGLGKCELWKHILVTLSHLFGFSRRVNFTRKDSLSTL